MNKKTKNLVLLIILVVGYILRFSASILHSYSSDELSAIIRLNFSSFGDLIELGVKTGDMHPAGVQVFMKLWSLLFGTSELAMRLPFVILGTLSIYLIFLIGKRYSERTGLFSAAIWSTLLFPVIQSELARPYSPGLFFILLSTVLIFNLIFDNLTKSQKWSTALWLGLSISATMYTHYFAFLLIVFMSITSLIWIKKDRLLPYLSSGVIAILLFLPHLKITIYQTSIDGGLQWLAPPGKFWLFEFVFHAFNASWILILSFSLAIITSFFFRKKYIKSQLSIILIVWFFGMYILAYSLSHTFTPILKFPVMLFCLPFLIVLISTLLRPLFSQKIIPLTLVIITLFSTTIEKKLWGNKHHEVFKELVEVIRNWEQKIGIENITNIMNVSNPNYLNYYANQTGPPLIFKKHIIEYGDADTLTQLLTSTKTDYLIFGYSGRHTPVQFLNQCLNHYPCITSNSSYTNSAVFLLSKQQRNTKVSFDIQQKISFFENQDFWKFDTHKLDLKRQIYSVDSTNQYYPQYNLKLNKLLISNASFVKVSLDANITLSNEITIVAIPENKFGEPINDNYGNPIWMGLDIETSLMQGKSGSFAFSIPENTPIDGHIKIYIWNRNKRPFIIRKLDIEIIENIWNN